MLLYAMSKFAHRVFPIAFPDILFRAPGGISHLTNQTQMCFVKPFRYSIDGSSYKTNILIKLEIFIGFFSHYLPQPLLTALNRY